MIGKKDAAACTGALLAGKYRLGRLLGEGGFGVVYAATNERLGQPVAIKLGKDRRGAVRMQREARAAARLRNPHVVRIYDADVLDDGTPYIAMEQLRGQTLSARLRKLGTLQVEEAVELLCQVCEALREAHACGLIHRDLKPSNLFLSSSASDSLFVKVLDFGLVKGVADDSEPLTESDALMGSPSYMSPEQVRGDRALDATTDIWALGVLLFEMLTGKLPFEGATRFGQLTSIVSDPPIPLRELRPDLPVELQHIVSRCLRKDCESRYHHVDEIVGDLAPFRGRTGATRSGFDADDGDDGEFGSVGATMVTLAPTEADPAPHPSHRRMSPVLGLVVTLLLGILGVTAWSAVRRPQTELGAAPSLDAVSSAPAANVSSAASPGADEPMVPARVAPQPAALGSAADAAPAKSGPPGSVSSTIESRPAAGRGPKAPEISAKPAVNARTRPAARAPRAEVVAPPAPRAPQAPQSDSPTKGLFLEPDF